MRFAIVIVVIALALLATVAADNRKVLVLPVDGNAAAAQRTSINEAVVNLAKTGIDGDVTAGDTTFSETAAAVGCTADQPTCAETMMKTLSVDELVWGEASTEGTSTTVTVHRAAKGVPARQQIVVIESTANGDAVNSGLQPMFTREGSGSDADHALGSGSAAVRPHTKSFFDTKERKLGFGFGAGGFLCLVVGISLWSAESGLQDQIDNHPNMTLTQLQDLHKLEDQAATKALLGNIFVGVGLAAGAISGYYFWKDHKNRNAPVVAPVPTEDGAGVKLVLGGRW